MEQRRRRSKRQLYLGILFVSLAIGAALLRSGLPSASPPAAEYIGISVQESLNRLGEPTTRLEFYPDEAFHAERAAIIERIRKSGKPMPEAFVELAWFEGENIITLRFAAEVDDEGNIVPRGTSIDAQRSVRTSAE